MVETSHSKTTRCDLGVYGLRKSTLYREHVSESNCHFKSVTLLSTISLNGRSIRVRWLYPAKWIRKTMKIHRSETFTCTAPMNSRIKQQRTPQHDTPSQTSKPIAFSRLPLSMFNRPMQLPRPRRDAVDTAQVRLWCGTLVVFSSRCRSK